MGMNHATLIIVLKNDDKTTSYYMLQVFNPDACLASHKYFYDILMAAEVFNTKNAAITAARAEEVKNYTGRGILIYDSCADKTYEQIVKRFQPVNVLRIQQE